MNNKRWFKTTYITYKRERQKRLSELKQNCYAQCLFQAVTFIYTRAPEYPALACFLAIIRTQLIDEFKIKITERGPFKR